MSSAGVAPKLDSDIGKPPTSVLDQSAGISAILIVRRVDLISEHRLMT